MNCNRSLLALFVSTITLIGFLCPVAGGQGPVARPPVKSATTAPAPDTLAAALPMVRPLSSGLAIMVSAEKQHLPKGATAIVPHSTLDSVAGAFGDITRRYGAVYAVAPSTMVILNANPSNPNIFEGMPADDDMMLLLASLSDGQWQQLISQQGLPLSIMTQDQQEMLVELLPGGKLRVAPWYPDHSMNYPDSQIQDLSSELPQCSLRLTRTFSVQLPSKDQSNSYFLDEEIHPPDSANKYKLVSRQDYGGSQDTVYGVPVRAVVANESKKGQLDFRSPALQPLVPLAGLKTVDDLVARIGQITHIELYADPRLGSRSLTLIGPASAAPAGDLLRAVGLCVTGAYRQVGPAFVLTDDVVGIGTRVMEWYEFEMDADAERAQYVEAAGESLFRNRSPQAVSWFDNPLAYAADQQKPAPGSTFFYMDSVDPEFLPTLQTTFDTLTEAQQQAVQASVDDHNKAYPRQPATTAGNIQINPQDSLQLLVPSLSAPVDMYASMDEQWVFKMPQDVADQRQAAQDELIKKTMASRPPIPAGAAPPGRREQAQAVPLKPEPRRAALVLAKTAREVDDDVAAIKKLGFNELWLVVFENGELRIPGSPLSPPASPSDGPDILTEAITDTQGTGIKVYPVLDLFYWGNNPAASVTDLNVLGENLNQARAHLQARQAMMPKNQGLEENDPGDAFPGVAVTEDSPAVQSSLQQIVHLLAQRQGVAGLVWKGIAPPGYSLGQNFEDTSSLLLGYQEPMRLAFLRKYHADPVDLFSGHYYVGKANTGLPLFQGMAGYRLSDDWNAFRLATNTAFLQDLYTAATTGLPKDSDLDIEVETRQDYSFNMSPYPQMFGVPFFSWNGLEGTLQSQEPGLPISKMPGGLMMTISPTFIVRMRKPFSALEFFTNPSSQAGFVFDFADSKPSVPTLTQLAAPAVDQGASVPKGN